MSQIKLTLLDNAHSFIQEALEKAVLAEKDEKQWKFAIFNLVQAIELLLKERLRQEHRILIFKNIDNPQITVSIEQAIARLKNIANVELNQTDVEDLAKAIEWRNQIVHYEFDFKTVELKLRFAKLLGLAAHFHDRFLGKPLDRIVSEGVWAEAVSILEYGQELFARAEDKFLAKNIEPTLVMDCRRCGYHAFVYQDDEDVCYVCGNEETVVECEECHEWFYEDEMEIIETDPDRCLSVTLCKSCCDAARDRYWDDD